MGYGLAALAPQGITVASGKAAELNVVITGENVEGFCELFTLTID